MAGRLKRRQGDSGTGIKDRHGDEETGGWGESRGRKMECEKVGRAEGNKNKRGQALYALATDTHGQTQTGKKGRR